MNEDDLQCCKECQKYWICQDGWQYQNGRYKEGECCDLCNNYIECKRIAGKNLTKWRYTGSNQKLERGGYV